MKANWMHVGVVSIVIIIALGLFIGLSQPADVAPENTQTPSDSQEPAETTTPEPVVMTVRASSSGYSPSIIEVEQGTPVMLTLRSTDGNNYSFTLSRYNIREEIIFGEESTVSFRASAVGEFEYYNDFGSSAPIKGTLVVTN